MFGKGFLHIPFIMSDPDPNVTTHEADEESMLTLLPTNGHGTHATNGHKDSPGIVSVILEKKTLPEIQPQPLLCPTEGPPDGGYGWVVVIASLLATTVVGMSIAGFSILYMEWTDYFHSDKGVTGWIGSINIACGNLLGRLKIYLICSSDTLANNIV